MRKFLLIISLLIPSTVWAHAGAGSPYVQINGLYAPANPLAGPYAETAQDISAQTVVVGEPTEFSVDTNILKADGFRWVWPGGQVAEGAKVQKTFITSGSHVVKLQATGQSNPFTEIDTIQVNVVPRQGYQLPVVKLSIQIGARSGDTQTVGFASRAGIDPSAQPGRVEWKFGEGGMATGPSVTHTFAGTDWVVYPKLRVYDSNGLFVDAVIELKSNEEGVTARNVPGLPEALADVGQAPSEPPWLLIVGLPTVGLLALLVWQFRRRASRR